MPMRHPNGIWIPTCSPASSSEVAPSTSIVLSEMAKVTVPPSPPLSVRAMTKRSMCRLVRHARTGPDPLDRVEHGRRPARPGRALLPVRNDVVERAKSRCPIVVRELKVQPVVTASWSACSSS